MKPFDHETCFELLEGYVFGTLDPEHRDGVEAHLDEGCDACLIQVRELGELSVHLAAAIPQVDPAPRVREAVMAHARGARSVPPDAAPRRVPRRSAATFAWLAAAAAVVAMLWAGSLRREVGELRADLAASRFAIARLEQGAVAYEEARRLLGKPCTRLVDLKGVAPHDKALGKVILHPDERGGVVYVYELPPTPEGMDYQLWGVLNGGPTSIGIFDVDASGQAVLRLQALPDPTAITAFQVTAEPRGGVPSPSGMTYLIGDNSLQAMH